MDKKIVELSIKMKPVAYKRRVSGYNPKLKRVVNYNDKKYEAGKKEIAKQVEKSLGVWELDSSSRFMVEVDAFYLPPAFSSVKKQDLIDEIILNGYGLEIKKEMKKQDLIDLLTSIYIMDERFYPINKYKYADVDNSIKSVLDACSGLVFEDDTQVVGIVSKKHYASEERIDIRIIKF